MTLILTAIPKILWVPVLYKISTLVDELLKLLSEKFPFFTKFLLL